MVKRILMSVVAVGLWAGFALTSEDNIAPDALTRATQGYNTYEGELAWLSDGLYPENSDEPGVFIWPNKGNLVFQFDEPRAVRGLRMRVGGDAGAYEAWAYRNAEFGEDGQTVGRDMEVLADVLNDEFAENAWVELLFERGVETDYIEVSTAGSAELYEVEILKAEQTQVWQPSWAGVKMRVVPPN